MRLFVRVVLGLVLVVTAAFLYLLYRAKAEGAPRSAAAISEKSAAVDDPFGVPTITGSSWEEIVEAEGFVIASERLFQMDLMRRAAAGRLCALVGAKALPLDRRRKEEDWEGVTERAYQALPEHERRMVDAYAHGVNRFIEGRAGHHSLEYLVLRTDPEPWRGQDTLLILLLMAEELTSSAPSEANEGRFRRALPAEWADFLFTPNHPWNEPMFGGPTPGTVIPSTSLPHHALVVIPEHLAVVVDAAALVPDQHAAYAALDLAGRPRWGLFLAGPSKTADIEQSLVIGAHGARSATVLLVG